MSAQPSPDDRNEIAPDREAQAIASFAARTAERLAEAWTVVSTNFGDRLGLYSSLAEGAGTADEIAARASTNPRLTREWLDGQVVAGIVDLVDDGRYSLPPAHALVLAVPDSPAFLGAAGAVLAATVQAEEQIVAAFRGDGRLSWSTQASGLSCAVDRSARTGYEHELVDRWIGELDGVTDRLRSGGRVADVGCGRGTALVVLASAFPDSTYVGIDGDEGSIAHGRAVVAAAGLTAKVDLRVDTAVNLDGGPYDLVCFLDALHDMGDPHTVLTRTRRQLADDGAVLLVEPAARETLTERVGDLPSRLHYPGSAFLCTPNALSQHEIALGNQVADSTWRELFFAAGFSSLRRIADTPLHRVFEAR